MAGKPLPRSGATTGGASPSPGLLPCLLLRRGRVCVPGENGPVTATAPDGTAFDPFDVVDRLTRDYPILYVVDLDGLERGDPQLDYLQEISREATIWVDGGVRTAEQAIDILISGARRAVLSSACLRGPREVKRAWRLSSELAFEIEIDRNGRLALAGTGWEGEDPFELARAVREIGPDHVILSPREADPDWGLVARLASAGPTWVNGSFQPRDIGRLESAHARGGIFHIDEILRTWREEPLPASDRPDE